MSELKIISEFSENEIVFSASNIKKNYLYGVSLVNPKTGETMDDSTIEFYVKAATQEVERYLGIYLNKKEVVEDLDFDIEDYYSKYNPIKVTYPVLKVKEVLGRLGNSEILKLPEQWMTFSKREYVNSRNLFMVINGNSTITFNTVSFINHFGFPMGVPFYSRRTDSIPCFWRITYDTGFCGIIPYDILDVIGMLSSIPLLAILGDVRDAGLSSKDLTIDGVRASYSTTSSATTSAYSARILEYTKQLDRKIKELRRHYESIIVESV